MDKNRQNLVGAGLKQAERDYKTTNFRPLIVGAAKHGFARGSPSLYTFSRNLYVPTDP